MVDLPYGYWYQALEQVARTLHPDDPGRITDTKAIRKAALLPDEGVVAYITDWDDGGVILLLLTDRRRVVRIQFHEDTARHIAIPLARVVFLGGEVQGITSRVTEVHAFDAVTFRFLLQTPGDPITLTLPFSVPNSVAGEEEIAFAQRLLAALAEEHAP